MATILKVPASLTKIYGADGLEVPIVDGLILVNETDAADLIDQGCERVPPAGDHIADAAAETVVAQFNTLLAELEALGILASS